MTEIKNEQIIRHIKSLWIREDNSLTIDAYRPKKKEICERYPTGYENNVSTQRRNCYPTVEDLENLKNTFKRTTLYCVDADHANDSGYPCINDHHCHVGITGDMEKLYTDFQTLELLARQSQKLHP